MNKNNAVDYLPLIQALADGKTLQENKVVVISRGENSSRISLNWVDTQFFDISRSVKEYRIKPEEDWNDQYIYFQDQTYPFGKVHVDEKYINLLDEMVKLKTRKEQKPKKWFRVAIVNEGPLITCMTESSEKIILKEYSTARWLTDRIEYE